MNLPTDTGVYVHYTSAITIFVLIGSHRFRFSFRARTRGQAGGVFAPPHAVNNAARYRALPGAVPSTTAATAARAGIFYKLQGHAIQTLYAFVQVTTISLNILFKSGARAPRPPFSRFGTGARAGAAPV